MSIEDPKYYELYDRLSNARSAVIKWYERGKKDWQGKRMARPFSYQEGDAFRIELRNYFDSKDKDEAARLAGNFAFDVAKKWLKDGRFRSDVRAVIVLSCEPYMKEEDKNQLDKLVRAILCNQTTSSDKTKNTSGSIVVCVQTVLEF